MQYTEPAESLYETLLCAGVVNDLRHWNARDSEQVDCRGSVWKVHSPGLKEVEKEKWRRAAVALGLAEVPRKYPSDEERARRRAGPLSPKLGPL